MLARFEVIMDDCIGCTLCKERAPDNFEMLEDRNVAHVVAQPKDEDEEEACLEAAEYCPIGALSVTTPESSDEQPTATTAAAGSSS